MACQPNEPELPPIRAHGAFFHYASTAEICPDTITNTENWMVSIAETLGIDNDQIKSVVYYHVDAELVKQHCDGALGCAHLLEASVEIFSSDWLSKHELIHALHLSAWPRRQPLLQEGLATAFDDTFPQRLSWMGDGQMLSALIETDYPLDDSHVYMPGGYLTYWIIHQYGPESLSNFWAAINPAATSADFDAAFEDEFGVSLTEFLAEVGVAPACQIVTCLGTPQPWDDDVWVMAVPRGCGDGVEGYALDDREFYRKYSSIEITQTGIYELTASAGIASIASCDISCTFGTSNFSTIEFSKGQAAELVLEPGNYRITAQSNGDLGDAEVRVRLVE